MILPVHILGGVLALVFGYTALFAAKGGTLHRTSGMFFAFAMIAMSLTGAVIAAFSSTGSSVIAGLLTFYFVTTGMLTVRKAPRPHWIDQAGIAVAIVVGLLAFREGSAMVTRGRPEGIPLFIFGATAMLGAVGDVRMIRAGGLVGSPRIKRHLWRMCFAMWVAAASFFLGPPGRVPDIINIKPLLPVPVILPLLMMAFWMWCLRVKKSLRGIVSVAAPSGAAVE